MEKDRNTGVFLNWQKRVLILAKAAFALFNAYNVISSPVKYPFLVKAISIYFLKNHLSCSFNSSLNQKYLFLEIIFSVPTGKKYYRKI